jgi:hypothetical protein
MAEVNLEEAWGTVEQLRAEKCDLERSLQQANTEAELFAKAIAISDEAFRDIAFAIQRAQESYIQPRLVLAGRNLFI